jgi:hypothetical protein
MKIGSHTVYRNKAGVRVPSVTTMASQLAKPALISSAAKLGEAYRQEWDKKADIGTLFHHMVALQLNGETVNSLEAKSIINSPDIDEIHNEAVNRMKSYLNWAKTHSITPIHIEKKLVSEELQVGGTPDLLSKYTSKSTLSDWKTGHVYDWRKKCVYEEIQIQLHAYAYMFREQGIDVDQMMIFQVTNDEVNEYKIPHNDKYMRLFRLLRELYEVRKLK